MTMRFLRPGHRALHQKTSFDSGKHGPFAETRTDKRPGLSSWKRWVAPALAASVLGAFLIPSPGVDKYFRSEIQKRVTPDDSLVLKAIVRGTRKGRLSVGQILDAYDFVASRIEYRNAPNWAIPRWPRETLAPIFEHCYSGSCKSVGDCKAIIAVLASMLEGIGAETRVVYTPNHVFLTVLVARERTMAKAKESAKKISGMIRQRYKDKGEYGFHFRRVESFYDVYLALDPTTGRVPGVVVGEVPLGFDTRPDAYGRPPRLK